MNIIKKKIKQINQDINFLINLDHVFELSGQYSYSDEQIETTNLLKSIIITGVCDSRLNEIIKYGFNNLLIEEKYILYNGTNNGVVLSKSNINNITYIIDNIEFSNNLITNTTNFKLKTKKIDNIKENLLFLNDKYYGYIDIKIDNKININRQDISILDSHYRLNAIKNIKDFEYYGGGYFNVFKI